MILKLDLHGNVLAKFSTKVEAAKDIEVDESTIRKAINNNRVVKKLFRYAVENNENNSFPKILFLDIETAPIKAAVFKIWKENISSDQILNDWFILTWAAKWINNDNVISDKLTSSEILNEDDSRIIKSLWNLVDKAEIIVGHNIEKFDTPKMNSRFLQHNLNFPSHYRQIDTKKIAKSVLGENSNSLNYLCKRFGLDTKIKTDINLWVEALKGSEKHIDEMLEYNINDVIILEKLYFKLLPFIKGHPNINVYNNKSSSCPNCGSENLSLIEHKKYYTQVGKYAMYRCNTCGSVSRSTVSIKFENKLNLRPIPM